MGEDFLGLRACLLLVILGTLALVDLRWRAKEKQARRLLYGGAWICTAAGMIFAAVFDQCTCTLSPEYFIYWKELNAQSSGHLRLLALDLGLAAGFSPGLITGLCFSIAALFGNSAGKIRLRTLLTHLGFPLCGIVIAALWIGGWHYQMETSALYDAVASLGLDSVDVQFMNMVWGIHKGAYIGGALGTILGTILIANHPGERGLTPNP